MSEPAASTPDAPGTRAHLVATLEHTAHLLPAQGPVTVFVHHNTLHAFEHLPFERAVVEGGALLGCEPWLSEDRYRDAIRTGRIAPEDLAAVVRDDLGQEAEAEVGGRVRRGDLVLALLHHGIPNARGPELDWLVTETDIHRSLRYDLRSIERRSILGDHDEAAVVGALWEASLAAAGAADRMPYTEPARFARLRDLLRLHTGQDTDAIVHPVLIRLCAAYMDQGVAYWPMPNRDQGFYPAIASLYGNATAPPPERWSARLIALLAEDRAAGRDEVASIQASLDALGVEPNDIARSLAASALALRGWAGMTNQLEERPDRVPVRAVPITFAGFMAVRLLLERAACAQVAADGLDHHSALAPLWRTLSPARRVRRNRRERAWRIFHASQLLGWSPAVLRGISPEAIAELERELIRFSGVELRRLLHLAYERHLHHGTLDALAAWRGGLAVEAPCWQGLFCVDEREESFRRHIEELAPDVETLGVAGFFGVAMAYRGLDDAHSRPLCPVVIRPRHEVHEVAVAPDGAFMARHARGRRALGHSRRLLGVGSHTFVRGTLISTFVGALAAVPLLFRVLAPGWSARFTRGATRVLDAPVDTRVAVERREGVPTLPGTVAGYTVEEMADVVERLLGDLGLIGRLAPLVLVVGHGSSSLNNPLESAYDCGACGGGHGGPNARAFAAMANHPEVRAVLLSRGRGLPDSTWFVAAEHNTASDAMTLYDRDLVPAGFHAA